MISNRSSILRKDNVRVCLLSIHKHQNDKLIIGDLIHSSHLGKWEFKSICIHIYIDIDIIYIYILFVLYNLFYLVMHKPNKYNLFSSYVYIYAKSTLVITPRTKCALVHMANMRLKVSVSSSTSLELKFDDWLLATLPWPCHLSPSLRKPEDKLFLLYFLYFDLSLSPFSFFSLFLFFHSLKFYWLSFYFDCLKYRRYSVTLSCSVPC